MDIGCGSGLLTKYCNENRIGSYTGIDITDKLFHDLKKINEGYNFIKNDITENSISGKYKNIFMIDVIEHIVTREKLKNAFENVKKMMEHDSVFFVGPTSQKTKKHFYYLHGWGTLDVSDMFEGYKCIRTPFMSGDAVIVRKHG